MERMAIVKDILSKSIYTSQGFVGTNNYYELMRKRLQPKFNCLHLQTNKEIHIHTVGNKKEYTEYSFYLNTLETKYGSRVLSFPLPENKGRTFGTLELDYKLIEFGYLGGSNWMFKSSDDVTITSQLLDVEIPDNVDFLYLPSISYEDVVTKDINYEDFNNLTGDWLPQTNFFMLRLSNVKHPFLYNIQEIEEVREFCVNHNIDKPWEVSHPYKFDNETILKRFVEKNELTGKLLITENSFTKLVHYIKKYKIGDPSHKNIYFTDCGVMHLGNSSNNISI